MKYPTYFLNTQIQLITLTYIFSITYGKDKPIEKLFVPFRFTKNPTDVRLLQLTLGGVTIDPFFTYSTARRRRRLSGRHMYMFSRHRKLHFCKIISFISGLECLQKVR